MKKEILAAFVAAMFTVPHPASAQSPSSDGTASTTADSSAEITTMEPVVVSAEVSPAQAGVKKEEAFQQLNLSLGTSAYTLTNTQIRSMAQGENTSINNILTRTPGVSTDTYGAIHFRNEDPFYRTYINGVLLPKGITGFGQSIDPRFIESMTTIVGAVPAYYPDGNYGIIDIKTKTGENAKGGSLGFYGGSYSTYQPSFSYGNSAGPVDFFFTGSWLHNAIGLENPTSSHYPIHDTTDQFSGFGIITLNLPNDAKLSLLGSANYQNFEIPNTPGQVSDFQFVNPSQFYKNSVNLDENQNEQSYFGILSYQQTIGDLSLQVSNTSRYSRVLFNPDAQGTLYYNGVAASIFQEVFTNDTAIDLVYQLGDYHTLRGGVLFQWGKVGEQDSIVAFPVEGDDDAEGAPILDEPNPPYNTDQSKWTTSIAVYLQDEWKITPQVTLNYGVRFEQVDAYVSEFQFSPRVNLVYQPVKQVAIHAGYARYFAPPPLQSVSPATINAFAGTTNAPDNFINDPVKSERSDYFDVGVNYMPVEGLAIGVDGYYKIAADQVDDGEFGEANIGSPYNYAHGYMYGIDISASYVNGGFSSFINFSASDGWATGITSSQFEFENDELAYINGNYVRFDQTQLFVGSAGMAYTWNNFTIHTDMIYQNGIRSDPVNQGKLPAYFVWNAGLEYVIQRVGPGDVHLRFDVLNLLDSSYLINSGTGIGEGAVKYGNRIGFYGGISYEW
ncbi:MAG: TonB-dependent receptor [Chthoniobacterales bacterium]